MTDWRAYLIRKTDIAVAWCHGWGVTFPPDAAFIGCLVHECGDQILFAGHTAEDAITLQALPPEKHWTGSVTREGDTRRLTMICGFGFRCEGPGVWSDGRFVFDDLPMFLPAEFRIGPEVVDAKGCAA